MTLETRSVVVLTTAHVSEATAQALSSGTLPLLMRFCVLRNFEEGWLIDARRLAAFRHEKVPEFSDLLEICAWAVKNGFDWIEFDRDAESVESLPVYDW